MFLDKGFQVVFGGHFSDARLCKLITCFSFQQLQSRFKSLLGLPNFLINIYLVSLYQDEMTWLIFSSSDQPGMLCSFKISTAWSCAWCLNPQADKTFSTGEFSSLDIVWVCIAYISVSAIGMNVHYTVG